MRRCFVFLRALDFHLRCRKLFSTLENEKNTNLQASLHLEDELYMYIVKTILIMYHHANYTNGFYFGVKEIHDCKTHWRNWGRGEGADAPPFDKHFTKKGRSKM